MIHKSNKGSYVIPIAIVIAGFLIAGAIFIIRPAETGKSAWEVNNSTAAMNEDDDPVLGDSTAPVTFINFGDFRCQFCARFQREIKPMIIEKYVKTGKVKYVYRDLITMGENSILAAEAANCAGEQDKYWDYADYLHGGETGHSNIYTTDSLTEIASSLDLKISLFKECLISGKYKEEIKKDTDDARASGATGTPTVFINGRLIIGLRPLGEYERIIEEELLKAGAL